MKKITLIIFVTMVLASCTSRPPDPPLQASIKSVPQQTTAVPIPMPPKIKTVNWKAHWSPFVQKMLKIESIRDGSLLMVNTLKNSTNGSVQTGKATAALSQLIDEDARKFQLISADQLNSARKMLGLSSDDSLESRSKAAGLARYVNAKYLLYGTIYGDVKQPNVDLQLMLVQTGEIIWSGNARLQD
ncbi:penicillin-binding protein activator LpoB [secondary endosymbiont of Ctenarytaina eucalypti]|uniref:Penicillin-binding protein activator LpoB n=1 Tax=secondary endosymbiont of Ctenarytaina eucalypti TaxID=1199245 RepID=J3TXZ9_9ENTR|nr:penicillin-binding protein activator LpoB [secondary endosymbiont of Ctenarytaina eucalypti]AFP85185.1 putative lipoprotein [secondary endosymbiont of Ctenarytaina eucalypti]